MTTKFHSSLIALGFFVVRVAGAPPLSNDLVTKGLRAVVLGTTEAVEYLPDGSLNRIVFPPRPLPIDWEPFEGEWVVQGRTTSAVYRGIKDNSLFIFNLDGALRWRTEARLFLKSRISANSDHSSLFVLAWHPPTDREGLWEVSAESVKLIMPLSLKGVLDRSAPNVLLQDGSAIVSIDNKILRCRFGSGKCTIVADGNLPVTSPSQQLLAYVGTDKRVKVATLDRPSVPILIGKRTAASSRPIWCPDESVLFVNERSAGSTELVAYSIKDASRISLLPTHGRDVGDFGCSDRTTRLLGSARLD